MDKQRKFWAMLLSLVLVLGMATPVVADQPDFRAPDRPGIPGRPDDFPWGNGTNTYVVSFSSGAEGSISVSIDGATPTYTSPIDVPEGSFVEFSVSPNIGYQVARWYVDGTFDSGITGNVHSISNLQTDVTVSVTFEPIPITHSVTFSYGSNGSISVTDAGGGVYFRWPGVLNGPQVINSVPDGATVILTAQPNTGFVVGAWSVVGATYTISSTGNTVLTITDIRNNVTVSVTFVAESITNTTFSVTVNNSELPDGTGVDQSGAGEYEEGDIVTIRAGSRTDYDFDGWTVVAGGVTLQNTENPTTTFTMPAQDVVVAAEWENQTIISNIPSGSGTTDDPFLIATPENLEWMADPVNEGYLNRHFRVVENIIAPENLVIARSIWLTPSGWIGSVPFSGVFNGNGHTITLNISLTSAEAVYFGNGLGLFGRIGSEGIVRNLSVNGSVQGNSSMGGIAGFNEGLIENSSNAGIVGEVGVTGSRIGGIAGNNTGIIWNSYVTGNVNGWASVGGIAGLNDGTVANSYFSGNVSGSGAIGGIIGSNASGEVSNSYVTGTVTGTSTGVGALAGENFGLISNSYVTGSVAGGMSNPNNTNDAGGLVGRNVGNILDSVALNSSVNLNGFWGRIWAETWDTAGGTPIGSGNRASTTTTFNGAFFNGIGTHYNEHGQSVTPSIFTTIEFWRDSLGWDFTNNWIWNPNTQLPILRDVGGDQNHTVTIPPNYESDPTPDPNAPSGTGTASDPFLIETTAHMRWLSELPLYNITWRYFRLNQPIDTPIEVDFMVPVFSGTFDGNNRSININLNEPNNNQTGLFGVVNSNGVVRNLNVTGVVNGRSGGGIVANNQGRIEDTSSSVNVTAEAGIVGGIVGVNHGTVVRSFATGNVSSSGGTVGGLAGNNQITGTIAYSFATGIVEASGSVGGLLGFNDGIVRDSFATGEVISSGSRAGGVVGTNGGTVTRTFSTGTITGNIQTGIIFGGVGGITGADEASPRFGTLSNSIAFNWNLEARNGMPNRINGSHQGTLDNNRAFIGIQLNGAYFSGDGTNPNSPNGQDLTLDEITNNYLSFWTNTMGWNANVWEFRQGQPPILRNIYNLGLQNPVLPPVPTLVEFSFETTTPAALTVLFADDFYRTYQTYRFYPTNDSTQHAPITQPHATEPRIQPTQQTTQRQERTSRQEYPIWPEPDITPFPYSTDTYWPTDIVLPPTEPVELEQVSPSFTTETITAFAPLAPYIATQTMTDELYLPDTLMATIHFPAMQTASWFGNIEEPSRKMTLPISVTWEMSQTEQAGVYVFTARVVDNMEVIVAPPKIMVTTIQ